ncbi:MAG: hypothetical protein Q9191_001835 [Dirinaria sp. TL-2023a]
MLELLRDTMVGHLLRWLSSGKILPHAEDKDPSLWRMYVSTEKSTKLSSSGPLQQPQVSGKYPAPASHQSSLEAGTDELDLRKPSTEYQIQRAETSDQGEAQTARKTSPNTPSREHSIALPQPASNSTAATTGDQEPERERMITTTSKTASAPDVPHDERSFPSLQKGPSDITPTTKKKPEHDDWIAEKGPKTGSDANSLCSGSSTALAQPKPVSTAVTPEKEKQEQEWITPKDSNTTSDPSNPEKRCSTASLQRQLNITGPISVKENPEQAWNAENTSKATTNVNTPYNGSNTALSQSGPSNSATVPGTEKPEQQWVTAAMGQEGMEISMQEGQVDGDPALEWKAEGTETAWNAVKLEAGYDEETETAKVEKIPTAEQVRNVVVWFGPQDPANPLNWTHRKRAFVSAQVYLLTLCTYIGTSIFSPASSNLENHFGVSSELATLTSSLAILGYGLGVMVWSPMSEAIRIGRKPVYIVTLLVFVGLQAGTALAVNIGMLLAFRILTGIFGAPVLAIGGASINDMYTPAQRGYAIVLWDVVSIAAPVLGPTIGGFAAQANGWRWTAWTLMWFSGGVLVLLIFLMPETNQSNILYRRSRRLRVLTGNKTLRSEQDVLGGQLSLLDTAQRLLARPFVMAFTEPILLVINLYIALLNAILFSSLDSFPMVFQGIYGFNLGQTGAAFFGLFVGSVLSAVPMFIYLRYRIEPQVNSSGQIKPEKRLPPAIVGAFLVPLSLLAFGWSARKSVHWIVPIVGSTFFGIAIVPITYTSLNYLPDAYPSHAASVLAGNELFRSSASAAFPLFATAMNKNLGIGPAASLLAGISSLFIPVPIILYYHGHKIRGRSKRAQQEFDE